MAIETTEATSVESIIRKFVAEELLFTDRLPIGDGDSFIENSIVDSTGILELEIFVERAFGIEVRDEDVVPENFDSVSKLASYIRRKQKAARVAGTQMA